MNTRDWPFQIGTFIAGLIVFSILDRQLPDAIAIFGTRVPMARLFAVLATLDSARLRPRTQSEWAFHRIKVVAAFLCAFALVYPLRGELLAAAERLLARLVTLTGLSGVEQVVSYPLTSRGKFDVRATANGVELLFTIDTGADPVVLTPSAARRLGFDIERLDFYLVNETANGIMRAAPVVIPEFRLGTIVVHDLPAVVNGVDMSSSLLGMEFLRRLRSWHVEGDRITLTY